MTVLYGWIMNSSLLDTCSAWWLAAEKGENAAAHLASRDFDCLPNRGISTAKKLLRRVALSCDGCVARSLRWRA
jgi:hypothetical protein